MTLSGTSAGSPKADRVGIAHSQRRESRAVINESDTGHHSIWNDQTNQMKEEWNMKRLTDEKWLRREPVGMSYKPNGDTGAAHSSLTRYSARCQ